MRAGFLLVLGVAAAGGCGSGRAPGPATAPGLEASRRALTTSLDAWKEGRRAPGGLIGAGPAVGVVDTLRPDRPLLTYEILGPLAADGPARPFAVRLALDAPREERTARYLVVGEDPLWVFRQEDYELILHWEHAMPAPAPEGGPR